MIPSMGRRRSGAGPLGPIFRILPILRVLPVLLVWPVVLVGPILLLPFAACGSPAGGSARGTAATAPVLPAPDPAAPVGTTAPPVGTTAPPDGSSPAPVPVLRPRVVREYPHDPEAFTQGLFFHDGVLYESTGLLGESTLRRVALETGEVLAERRLLPSLFGEGAALVGDRIMQLTWKAGIGFAYDRDSFRLLREFRYPGEGWGLTYDGEHLVMSDGSDTLRFRDPDTFREVRRLPVAADGEPVFNLNELEWIEGEIWANLWTEDRIARIHPETGEVLAFLDLAGILPAASRHPGTDVLNGIAWDPDRRRIFVTGKKWPTLFEIELVETEESR